MLKLKKMNNTIQITIIFLIVSQISCQNGFNLFLDQDVHEIDPFSLSIDDTYQEFSYLNITEIKNGLSVENIDKASAYCFSIMLNDFVDMDIETENRFLRVNFIKLNSTKTFNVIGVQGLEQSKFHRIFIQQNGIISYSYPTDRILNAKNEKIIESNNLVKEKTFTWSQGDILQVFYFAEDKSLLIYNQTKDNLFKFPQSLLNQVGKRFSIFVGVSSYNDRILLSNNIM